MFNCDIPLFLRLRGKVDDSQTLTTNLGSAIGSGC